MKTASGFTLPFVVICTLIISACTTTPYTRHKSPNISGSITINGEKTAGIPIYLSLDSNDQHCMKIHSRTITSPTGEFRLPSVKEQMSYTPLMTHYLDEWVVCADINNQRIMLYTDNRYGMGSVISAVHLRCDFDSSLLTAKSCKKVQ